MEANYQTVFDISQKWPQWWFPAFGLIFVIIGSLILKFSMKKSTRYFGVFFMGFVILWTFATAIATHLNYSALQEIYREGRSQVVEGKVEHFKPMPYGGHAMESFTVKGVNFEYSDYVITPAFNNTSSHVGPI